MARFKKCTEKDISVLLETSSDSSVEELDKSYVPKKSMDNDSFDLSDSDNIFEKNKLFLLQTNALQKEQASLRLKLRRSTEQSMYKIDTESEDEKLKRSTRNTKRHLKSLQDENQVLRKGARIIKVPERYSDYKCSSKPRVSVLQRDQINNDEKKLLLNSLDTINMRKKETNKHIVKSDDSDCVCIFFNPKTSSTKSKLKVNKQNHVYSIEDVNDDTTPKVYRTRSKYRFLSVDEELKKDIDKVSPNNKIYLETDARQNISFEDTPKTSRIQKSTRKSILNISNKYETIPKDENKTDKMEVIHKVDKNLSIKTNQRNEAIDSLMVQNDLSIPKICVLKQGTLKPSMKMRTDILAKPVTPLQEIRTKLHVSAVPKSLPCREEEFNNIYTFLESKLLDNSGG